MKKAIIATVLVLASVGVFAMGGEESYSRNTDPAYDFVDDNSVSPTGFWENIYETKFNLDSQRFMPTVVARSCKGLVVYIDYMPIREIEWAVAKNEAMKTYFEIYVISDQVASAEEAAETEADAEAVPVTAPAAGPGETITANGEVIKLVGAADVGNMVKYRIVGRNVIFDFIDLPATTKLITVKIQTGDANRYVSTQFKASGLASRQ